MSRTAVVVGAGIAGASVAYFLAQRGWSVTSVDAGRDTASHVPSALINPVRGQSGQVPARALEGLAFTWSLVATLARQGHTVAHGQSGVHRPVPDASAEARFRRNLPTGLAHAWLDPGDVPGLPPGWTRVLHLPQGGWLDGAALCRALLAASGARSVTAQAVQTSPAAVTLGSGEVLRADVVVHCGGSAGAQMSSPQMSGQPGTHRAGTLLLTREPAVAVPRSFGAYLAPAAAGGVLGATFEAPSPTSAPTFPSRSLGWLLDKGAALTDLGEVQVTGSWTGSRLSGLTHGRRADGVWTLTGLGSKGFLLGPLLARDLAEQIGAFPGPAAPASRGG